MLTAGNDAGRAERMPERAVAALTGGGAAFLEAQALAALAQALAACGDTAAADQARQRVDHLYSAADLPEQGVACNPVELPGRHTRNAGEVLRHGGVFPCGLRL